MTEKWIDLFFQRPSSKLFVRIDQEFIASSFNVYGLKARVKNFHFAYEMLRKGSISSANATDLERDEIDKQTELLYGLLHLRYLLTKPGMQLMYEKFNQDFFPICPRVYCKGTHCLPYGITEDPGEHTVRMFCPCCSDIYNVTDPDLKKVDGAFFGSSWVHMFLTKYPQVIPKDPPRVYVPKIFGFRLCRTEDAEEESEYSEEESDTISSS